MTSTEPCVLHDLWPCAICNGTDKAFQASLSEPYGSDLEPGERIAPGVVAARFPGLCASCKQNYGISSPIRYSTRATGFVAMACCG